MVLSAVGSFCLFFFCFVAVMFGFVSVLFGFVVVLFGFVGFCFVMALLWFCLFVCAVVLFGFVWFCYVLLCWPSAEWPSLRFTSRRSLTPSMPGFSPPTRELRPANFMVTRSWTREPGRAKTQGFTA